MIWGPTIQIPYLGHAKPGLFRRKSKKKVAHTVNIRTPKYT